MKNKKQNISNPIHRVSKVSNSQMIMYMDNSSYFIFSCPPFIINTFGMLTKCQPYQLELSNKFLETKSTTALCYEFVTYYTKYEHNSYIYVYVHIYYLSNFCYTLERHSILMFESIQKVRRKCIWIWNKTWMPVQHPSIFWYTFEMSASQIKFWHICFNDRAVLWIC